jgi:hypothetical protein
MNIPNRTAAVLRSPKFFYVIVGLLVIQAVWIALSGRYPMAFDEDFHIGVIRLYATHYLPVWSAHPAGGDAFGAVARDPSYLFHYLMSFPYSLAGVFTHNETIKIIILRFIDIALFVSGLPLYRALLLKTGASRSIVHASLLLFVLVPIVPFLAAQVNYDNLIMPLTALTLLLALRVQDSLRAKSLDVIALLELLVVGLLSSIVKYAYLPVFLAVAGYLLVRGYQVYRRPSKLLRALQSSWRRLEGSLRWVLLGLLLVASLLVAERYVGNIARYHTPVPDCAQVLAYDRCKSYGPWIRDYNFALNKRPDADKNPIRYTQHWMYGMWFRTYFAVDGPASEFQTRGPLAAPAIGGIVSAVVGLLAFALMAPRLWRRYNRSAFTLFSVVAVLYLVILWLTEYQLYLQTSVPVAINGRYLLPVLPVAIVMTVLGVRELLGHHRGLQTLIATGVLICSLWGGGALTYILRSNDGWYWSGVPTATVNHVLQRRLGPITPGYNKPTLYLH